MTTTVTGDLPSRYVRNSKLIPGTTVSWLQYRTRAAMHADRDETLGRTRTGLFWSMAPGRAIWVKPDTPDNGEPVLIKVYRRLVSGVAHAYALNDELGAEVNR